MDSLKEYIRQLPKEQLIDLFIRTMKKEPEVVRIPLSIFKAKLSSLELVVKYLRENLGYSNKKTAMMLMRSPQTTWLTYRNAKTKHPGPLTVIPSPDDLPLKIFEDSRLSVLESIVHHLMQNMLPKEIASVLNRKEKTITTVFYRSKKKLNLNRKVYEL